MKTKMLAVSHLNKSFGAQKVISNLSFDVPYAARAALFAPSGSGKTTLLHILARLQTPDSGVFELADARPVVIFQEARLFPHLTVEENIFLPFKVQNRPINAQTRRDYAHWMEVCELGAFKGHYPYQLSGGMKQKTAIIRGFLQKPAFMMMDEPFQSIGQQSKKEMIDYMLATNPEMTLLLVTHDPEEVQLLAHFMLFFSSPVLGQYTCIETSSQYFQALCWPWASPGSSWFEPFPDYANARLG